MKLYIVTARCGNEMEPPIVVKTKKEAYKIAGDYVLDGARNTYADDGGNWNARRSTIQKWADENGYDFDDFYFWDGGSEAYEADVTAFDTANL